MKANHHYRGISFLLIAAYLLAACRSYQTINAGDASPRFDRSPTSGVSTSQIAANIFRAAKAMTTRGFTMHGMDYSLASFGDMGGVLLVGDQAGLHGMITRDGVFIGREIEKPACASDDHSIWCGSAHDHTRYRADHANHDHSHDHTNDPLPWWK